MKAVLCKQHGLPETLVVEEVPDLVPGPKQVVIEPLGVTYGAEELQLR